ncbi:unnamed protein product, partial [Effrenium voratum]
PAMQKLQACFLQLSNGADTVPTHVFRDLLQKLLPQVSELEVNLLLSPCAVSATHTDLRRLLSELQLSAEDERERQLKEARREVLALKNVLRRQPLEFTVGQYNILAGYMGNNMEPWFLYGIDMSEARRKEVFRLHGARGSDGKPANPGWPNYVRGILTEEEIRRVEEVHREHFDWPNRKDRLLEVIRDMDVDILSLVECDHYEDHFKPALEELGYDSTWRKRPRPSSADGCCVAWRQGVFEMQAEQSVEFIDKLCPKEGKVYKDRIAVIALLRSCVAKQRVCLVSTHLQRNPEDPAQDMLRARQAGNAVGQVLRALVEFATQNNALDAPVILTGDLNCTSFGRLRGVANTLSLLNREVVLHPFTFDCADVPTGVTSVTMARCMRIDAIVYQSQCLELVDVQEIPDVSPAEPIPSAQQPSDHVPIVAQFRTESQNYVKPVIIWLQLHIFQILISPRLGRVPERAMAAEAPLISAEREMLEAVASDDAERAAGLMRSDAMTAQLLKLRVRPTYHDATATEAFFHSVASYGLSFGLGENITQLAKRNGATDVLAILQNVEVRLGLDAARRIEAEAELLSIIRSKNRRKLLQFLRTCPIIDELLKAQVKASYHDAKDKEAVYHSLASYELNFAIGESLREVALRNGCCMADDFLPPEVQDEAPAAPAPPMATGDLRVVLTSAMTGEAICSLDAGRQWTLAMLARAANSSAPAKGCRVFLRGSAALTAGTVLADLAE